MASLRLENVTLEYPVLDSIRNKFSANLEKAKLVGGRLQQSVNNKAKVVALNNISLALNDGDRLALLGHNGSGKTSLLKTMSGFYQPSAGQVLRQGRLASVLNMVSGLRMNLSSDENVDLALQVAGIDKLERSKLKLEILTHSQLGEFTSLPISKLSSGMLMRLAFYLSTMTKPDILLLDEWVGVGDLAFIDKASERLASMVEGSGIVVYATHNRTIAAKLCNKAVCLHRGEIIAHGEVKSVCDQYTDIMQGR